LRPVAAAGDAPACDEAHRRSATKIDEGRRSSSRTATNPIMAAAVSPPVGQKGSILYVDDEPQNLELFRLQFEKEFHIHVANDAAEALALLEREPVSVVLTDERMPGMRGVDLLARILERWPDVVRVIVSAYNDSDRLILAMNRGHALEYILKPWSVDEVRACIKRCLALAERWRLLVRGAEVGATLAMLATEDRRRRSIAAIVGASAGWLRTLDLARRAAQSDATVLIEAETGTGKEIIAGFIHDASPRALEPFVRVNCGALAEGVLESELFGHEQGAFTGAVRTHKGRFEVADGGTLFLDEIGDISPRLQVALLRVLQERTFERVGGTKTIKVDVRIIAATHRNLRAAVEQGRFREDLFYRLNVIPVAVPPLRERREDIALLVDHFIAEHAAGRRRPRAAPGVIDALTAYDWPGNVRELENVVQRALVLGDGEELTLEDFCLQLQPASGGDQSPREEARELEVKELRQAIVRCGGNLARAARMLGIPRTTLASRAAKLGLLR
jgi:DNA-binding NtrC family response regulator